MYYGFEPSQMSNMQLLIAKRNSERWIRAGWTFCRGERNRQVTESFRRTIKRIQAEQTGKIAVSQ